MEFLTCTVFLFVACIGGGFTAEAATTVNFYHANRIVGGQEVHLGELPYQLSLQVDGGHICGASLIQIDNVQLGVTAAHCVFQSEHLPYVLVAGVVDLSETTKFKQSRGVANIVVHENYSDYEYSDDLALLFLSDSFKLDEYVAIIDLPVELQETVGNVTVSGWGSTKIGGNTPDKLQKIDSPVIAADACKVAWEDFVPITDGMLCSNHPTGEESPCHGDSGGPAAGTDDNGTSYLAGVVSFGRSCGHPEFPAVYTRVSKYVGWMKGMV